jgi:YD repeat-containing protein
MKNQSSLLLTASILFLYSCSKDNNPTNPNNASLPKTYTEDIRSSVVGNSVTTYNLTYDDHNRLVALAATPAPPSINFAYAYPSNNTVTMDLYEGGSLSIHEMLWINNSSFLDTTFQYDNTGDTSTEKYIYNGNGQLIQANEYNYSSSGTTLSNKTNYTYDNQGNAISSVDIQGNSNTYTYYSDLTNNFNLYQTFLPQPINFLKTQVLNSGGTTVSTTHYYTFDSQKRLIKDSTSIVEFDFTAIKTYTY